MAHFHYSGSHYLCGISEARCTSSTLQRVVEGQFSFRGHYAAPCHFGTCARLRRARGDEDWTRRGAAARSHNFGWLVFQQARHKPPRCSPWVVRRNTAGGAGVCHDDCCGIRDRYSGSGVSQQLPFHAALTSSDLHTNHDCQKQEIMNPKVDGFLRKAEKWRGELEKLRVICLDPGLTEELKWGKPCYAYLKSNVVLIHGFKEYCALLFMKGALLKEGNGILIQQTENVQAARQIRFMNVREIVEMKPVL